MDKKLKSTVLLFLTAMIWGFAFVAQRVGADYVGTFTFNGIRFALGALSLIPVTLIFEREAPDSEKHRRTVKAAFLAGFVLFAASTLQQFGVELTCSAGKAGFITGLYTVLVPVFSLLFYRKKSRWNIWVGVCFAVIGLFLLSVNEELSIGVGDLVLLVGAIFWAFHILVIDRYIDDISPMKFSLYQFAVCAIFSLIGMAFTEQVSPAALKSAALPILYGGIMSVGVAYSCQVLGQRDADPTYAAIIFSTESVFSALGGALILKERLPAKGYLGCALIFTGIIISQLRERSAGS